LTALLAGLVSAPLSAGSVLAARSAGSVLAALSAYCLDVLPDDCRTSDSEALLEVISSVQREVAEMDQTPNSNSGAEGRSSLYSKEMTSKLR